MRAAHAVGARWYRVLFRHLLPNTLGVIIVFVFLELPGVVLGEAFLSFLGPRDQPAEGLLGHARAGRLRLVPVPPVPHRRARASAIAWLILSAFFVADGLRDALDPRTRENFS